MSEIAELNANETEIVPLEEFAERAYLEYAMYVILDRALPHIGDGLKPVQRRIVYAMSELGLKAGAKYKKSARTVGDVLGKFHPHGDTACYEAMVLLAQSFSCRYPLVDGQGNWGAPDDPKSFAAMRYTESRLSPYAEVLLKELNLGAVDWVPNFDGTLDEPAILPARLPNILINGASGIAVGMATDIPPHNLREVAQACIMLLENPHADLDDLCQCIQGPDFPTEAEIITPRKEIIEIYRTGRGTVRTRAAWYRENGDIVVTALPHQVAGAKVIEQIAAQIQTKKLPMLSDIRDESDHEDPVRLVIVPRSNRVDVDALMAHLFATTDLERTARVNINLIGLNGRPKVRDLKDLLVEWIAFRRQMVKKRLEYRLDQVLSRLHILEGFLIAFMDIDAVVRIIRNTDHPKPALMKRFKLSEKQVDAILELRLRQLAKLEEKKLRDEQNALEKEKDELEKTLGSGARLDRLIRNELAEDAKTHGDDRRSPIIEREEAQAMSKAETLPSEPVTVVLSVNGWVRAAKGHDVDPENLSYKAGDRVLETAKGKNTQEAIFLDSTGRSYSMPAYTLPSARSQGEPLSGRLNLPEGAKILTVLMGSPDRQLLLASDAGYGFIVKLGELVTNHRAGKTILTLPSNSEPLLPVSVDSPETDLLATVTSEGRLLVFPVRDLPMLTKGKGNKIIGIPPARLASREEFVTGLFLFQPGAHLAIHAGKRRLTLRFESLEPYMGERGRRGKKLPKGFRKVDRLEITQPEQLGGGPEQLVLE